MSLWRKAHARKRYAGQVSLALDEIEECVPDDGTLGKLVESHEIERVLDGFLACLPEREREVFVQGYWYLRSAAEIAGDLGISATNVGTILCRLRAQLKEALEKEGVGV